MTPAAFFLLLAPAAPLLLLPLVAALRRPLWLLPFAPVPGLAAALFTPQGEVASLPQLLLGVGVVLDPPGAVLLGFASLLWILAGAYAVRYLDGKPGAARFAGFWLATLSGTLGVFTAADVATFYVSFAVLSLAAYGLVVHDGTPKARRAGRIYLILTIFGETALLGGFILGASGAESLAIADVRAAIAASPWRDLAMSGLVVGLGLKAGLVPLHVWLPLAHPAAPVPASAVLSGVIVKAGIGGLMRFLPMEADLASGGAALAALGLLTAYYGALVGLAQRDPKAILAYSTLSQMGLVVAVLGTGMGTANADALRDAVALYAVQHGLAKGALFLGVGVLLAAGTAHRRTLLALAAFLALSIAGLPFTGGGLGKLALKGFLEGALYQLVTLSALTTTLLMLRFLWVMAAEPVKDPMARPPRTLTLCWTAAALASFVVPLWLFPALSGSSFAYAAQPENLWSALWPILSGVGIVLAVVGSGKMPAVHLPQGDIVVFAEALAVRLRRVRRGIAPAPAPTLAPLGASAATRVGAAAEAAEASFRQWPLAGTALLALAGLAVLALAR